MGKPGYFLITVLFLVSWRVPAQQSSDYRNYHICIIQAELLIIEEKFEKALVLMDSVFNEYAYVFLRDYKVAAQIALYVGDKKKSFEYLRVGITNGWTLSEINENSTVHSLITADLCSRL